MLAVLLQERAVARGDGTKAKRKRLPLPSRERGGGEGASSPAIRLQYSRKVGQHVVVLEAQYTIALLLQPRISHAVRFAVLVLSTVHLDHQARGKQTKSTIYGPIGCWRLNLWEASR